MYNSKVRNFWQELPKPFTVLAPMDDVTDVVFREIIAELAKPDVLITEFVNVEALNSAGRDVMIGRLKYTARQRPIVAQLWGLDPQNYFLAAKLVTELGFDGVDINLGCPERKVLKIGAGAALINNQPLVAEIIKAAKDGAGGLPVSVKTRIGVKRIQTEDWFSFLLNQNLDAITVHGRTASEMSKVPAHWDEIAKAVKLRNELSPKTIIIGNGDVKSCVDATVRAQEYGVDGVMIGRGIFADPAAFSKAPLTLLPQDRLNLLLKHTNLFVKTWGKTKNFAIMKKFFKIYCSGFDDATKLREKLMRTKSLEEVIIVVEPFMARQAS